MLLGQKVDLIYYLSFSANSYVCLIGGQMQT